MVVDGVPPDAHWRFFDEMPWYAIPVANLCSDVNVEAWGAITVVFLLLKFFAVSAITNATVAALIVTVATLTALVWFHVFVLVGARSHRALYAQVPFSKFLQTFWVGAIVCPVGVYLVRAAVGAAIALVPGVSTIASPADVVSGSANQESEASASDPSASQLEVAGGGTSLAVAFVVAYVAAGFAEEAAKYFGIARYYPPDQLERDAADGGSRAVSSSGLLEPGGGVAHAQTRSPRGGLPRLRRRARFLFTENIQYGANVYAVATAWGDAGNVTTRQNVTIDAVLDPFTDYGDAEATPAAELAIRARARTWDTELEAPSLPALASHVTSRTAEGKMGRRFDPVAVAREARSLPGASLSPPAIRGVGEDARVGESAMVRGRRVHIYRSEAAIEEAARNEAIAVEGPESVEMSGRFASTVRRERETRRGGVGDVPPRIGPHARRVGGAHVDTLRAPTVASDGRRRVRSRRRPAMHLVVVVLPRNLRLCHHGGARARRRGRE